MERYAADFLAHDVEAVIARYHSQGAHHVGHGAKTLVPFDAIGRMYRQGGPGPVAFELGNLSFEVLSNDAVVVIGTFRAQWIPDVPEVVASFTGLLVREDGELRIRLEDESFDSLRSFSCAADIEFCESPLDRASVARYLGEYQAGPQRIHVFEQDGHTREWRDDSRCDDRHGRRGLPVDQRRLSTRHRLRAHVPRSLRDPAVAEPLRRIL
jgi:hypothetical protein